MLVQRAASEGPRWTRAVEDQSAPIPEEITSERGRIIYIVRRAQLPAASQGELVEHSAGAFVTVPDVRIIEALGSQHSFSAC